MNHMNFTFYKIWYYSINPLCPSDAIWGQISGSTLAQVMACCCIISSDLNYQKFCTFFLHANDFFVFLDQLCTFQICNIPSPQVLSTLSQSPCTALGWEFCLPSGLCKGTVYGFWYTVEVPTRLCGPTIYPEPTATEAYPNLYLGHQAIGGHFSYPTSSPTSIRLRLWSSLWVLWAVWVNTMPAVALFSCITINGTENRKSL